MPNRFRLFRTAQDAAGVWAHGRIGDAFGDFSFSCVAPTTDYAIIRTVNAMFDYTEGDATELSFVTGDKVGVICDTNPSWWLGCVRGRIGACMRENCLCVEALC